MRHATSKAIKIQAQKDRSVLQLARDVIQGEPARSRLLKEPFAHQMAKNSVQRVLICAGRGRKICNPRVPRCDVIGNPQRGGNMHAPWRAEIGQVPKAHQEMMTELFAASAKLNRVDLERTLLRKVGEAIHRFKMIRNGDRIAVAVSGGKDSVTLLEALILLQRRAPIDFSLCAFTVEQGKFLAPVQAVGEYIRSLGIDWTYYTDNPSLRLLEEQPGHGCDLCSRFRRRAVYQIARGLKCNVIAFGHTADDFCESLLRNIMYTGRISALPAVTWSRQRDFRLIRPLVFVNEEITRGWVEAKGVPVVPCGCSLRTGTVRRGIRETLADWERETPHLRENILSAMGNVNHGRLLDTRYLDLEGELDDEQEDAAPATDLVQLQPA
ncbi:MAG: tRNA 2-thiocytidine biosynthesis protein TtcA [Bryobacterales bacterium]|jgi:tRNA 2-thiocytidine biosynthesis protein TtcA|nr:tRNA 2-thiocytidine biosynthesis protein TtcA [Bryobacterales bacterium]